jgi:multicomponent K+:H+ antiporter subunit E
MSTRTRWLPHPAITVVLVILWLLLQKSVAPGHVLLAILLGVGIPIFSSRFWPEPVRIGSPATIVRFVAIVLWDIVIANLSMVRLVLGPSSAIKPAFVRVPVDVEDDFALTALASTISLTPGTVTARVSADRHSLLVHALAVEDEAALVDTIKRRYEAPIKEIFRC